MKENTAPVNYSVCLGAALFELRVCECVYHCAAAVIILNSAHSAIRHCGWGSLKRAAFFDRRDVTVRADAVADARKNSPTCRSFKMVQKPARGP